MTKSVLFAAHWLTDYGGLHENVFDTVFAFRQAGHACVVIAPKASFNEKFLAIGADVIEHDLVDTASAAEACQRRGPYDLIHAHPFKAREAAIAVAKPTSVPVILTIHGQYLDQFDPMIRRIVCVAPRIADHVLAHSAVDPSIITVIPNAVEANVFDPAYSALEPPRSENRLVITVCSRIDPDKKILFQAVSDLIDFAAMGRLNLVVRLQGDNFYGRVDGFRMAIERAAASGHVAVETMGWNADRASLAAALGQSDLVIGSGRAAAEAVACGRPTVAVASRGYVGLIDANSIGLALATNFGGVLEPATVYRRSRLIADLVRFRDLSVKDLAAIRTEMLQTNDRKTVNQRQLALAAELWRS